MEKFGKIVAAPQKRGRGKPSLGDTQRVITHMPGALVTRIDAYAAAGGLTRAAAIRALLEQGLMAALPAAALEEVPF